MRLDEMVLGEMRLDEMVLGEMGLDEMRLGEMGLGEMRLGEMVSGMKLWQNPFQMVLKNFDDIGWKLHRKLKNVDSILKIFK